MCAELPRYSEAISAPSWANYSCSAASRGSRLNAKPWVAHMEKRRMTCVFMHVCEDVLIRVGGKGWENGSVWCRKKWDAQRLTIITCFPIRSNCSCSLNGWAVSPCNDKSVSTGPAVAFISSRRDYLLVKSLWTIYEQSDLLVCAMQKWISYLVFLCCFAIQISQHS